MGPVKIRFLPAQSSKAEIRRSSGTPADGAKINRRLPVIRQPQAHVPGPMRRGPRDLGLHPQPGPVRLGHGPHTGRHKPGAPPGSSRTKVEFLICTAAAVQDEKFSHIPLPQSFDKSTGFKFTATRPRQLHRHFPNQDPSVHPPANLRRQFPGWLCPQFPQRLPSGLQTGPCQIIHCRRPLRQFLPLLPGRRRSCSRHR